MTPLKIRSTEKLASSNTQGLCDVERVIKRYSDNYDNNGLKIGTIIIIKSRMFQEKEVVTKEVDDDGNEVDVKTIERRYINGNDHERAWEFTTQQIDAFREQLKDQLKGKNENEQRLIVFIAQTQVAGDNGKGWQGMSIWTPDVQPYKTVSTFSN